MIMLGLWLISAVPVYIMYRRLRKPMPTLLVVLGALTAFMLAMISLGEYSTLWVRLTMAGVWMLLAAGFIVANRKLGRSTPASVNKGSADKPEGAPRDPQTIIDRLKSLGFAVSTDVQYKNQTLAFVARKAGFEIGYLCVVETFFMAARFDHPDMPVVEEYGKTCFEYARQQRVVSRPWGFLHRTRYYPVSMVSGADEALVRIVRSKAPTRQRSGLGLPIIWDLADGTIHFSRATTGYPGIGDVTWDLLRQKALDVFVPGAHGAPAPFPEMEEEESKTSASGANSAETVRALDEFKNAEVERRWKAIRIMWASAIAVMMAIVILVCVTARKTDSSQASDSTEQKYVVFTMVVMSAVFLALAFVVRRVIGNLGSRVHRLEGSYVFGTIFVTSMCGTVSILGAAVFLTEGRNYAWLFLFAGISALAIVLLRPRKQDLMKLALYSKRGSE